MSTESIRSRSPEETRAIGEALGSLVDVGDMVLLSGELGAGKTVFVQGMATGLGYGGTVSSKSFVLLGEYEGRLKLFHADLYRLDDPEMVEDLALDELVADGVVAVEWPERADSRLPEQGLFVRFTIEADEGRTISLEPRGERAAELAAQLRKTVGA